MNNTISVYELLGLIKDDKAPNSIIYKREYFKYSKENRDYIGENKYLFSDFADLISILNEKVEILEEDKPIIEKIDTTTENTLFTMECFTGIPEKAQDWNFNILKNTLNQIIDYINKKEKDND